MRAAEQAGGTAAGQSDKGLRVSGLGCLDGLGFRRV